MISGRKEQAKGPKSYSCGDVLIYYYIPNYLGIQILVADFESN